MRMSASAEPKRNSASVFAKSVLPTPVGPRNRKEPMGRVSEEMPTRARTIARASVAMASRCPRTVAQRSRSILVKRHSSSPSSECTGISVMRETACATSSAKIDSASRALHSTFSAWSRLRSCTTSVCKERARAQSSSAMARSVSVVRLATFMEKERNTCVSARCCTRFMAPTSSIRSIALSGKNRSGM